MSDRGYVTRVASAVPTAPFTVFAMKPPKPESGASELSMSRRALRTRLSVSPMLMVSFTNDREMARSVDVMVMLPAEDFVAAPLADPALCRGERSQAEAASSAHVTAIRLEIRIVVFARFGDRNGGSPLTLSASCAAGP